jgi:hypothetical protein
MVINAITVLGASKPFVKVLTRFTTSGMSAQNRFNKCYQPIAKAQGKRGISRITGLAYNTVVSIVCSSSLRAQLVHNDSVEQVETEEVSADQMWSFVQKNRNNVSLMS